MITERQAQRLIAYLELARTAIDNAELSVVAAQGGERAGLALAKAAGQIVAGAESLKSCMEDITVIGNDLMEQNTNGARTVGSTTG